MAKFTDRVLHAMTTGKPLDMALASWAYSRANGLTIWQSFKGAAELFIDYRIRRAAAGEGDGNNNEEKTK